MKFEFKPTDEQLAIFDWFQNGAGNIIVGARAGGYKTSTIIHGLNIAPEKNSVYGVFNTKLKDEAAKKITNKNVIVKTFHSIGFDFVKLYWGNLRPHAYVEFARIKSLAPDAPKQIHFVAAQLVSFLKNSYSVPSLKDATDVCNLRGIDEGNNSDWDIEKISKLALQSIALSMERSKDGQISFDDMVFLPVAKGWIKPIYDFGAFDEVQDLNANQLELAAGICSGRVCFVGDDKQKIYGFRGAMNNSLTLFKERLNAQEFKLTVCGRCPRKVVELAQTIVPDIRPTETAIDGEIVNANSDKILDMAKVRDVVLSRTNAALMPICLSLLRKKIPAYIEGREIGKHLIDIIDEIGGNINSFADKLDGWLTARIAKTTGWNASQRCATYQDEAETLKTLAEDSLSIDNLKNKINSLFIDADYVRVPSVICSTIHKCKGREFDNVFLLTYTFKKSKGADKDEEDNIYYVGITRTKKRLVMVSEAK